MIDWKTLDLGTKTTGNIKIVCPACIDRRKNKRDKALSVNIDKGLAKCHYCEEISIRDFKEKQESQNFAFPPQNIGNYTKLSEGLVKWFKTRAISQRTIIECKITEEKYYQPSLGKEVNNVVFNYFEGDKLINKKYRSGNKKWTQTPKTQSIFYGINDIIGKKECYIVEGEMDKLALWEVGIKNAISLPNGANDNDDVWRHAEQYLSGIEKFYIAVDCDGKGDEVSEKIAQRLGRWRCEKVTFKNKDANDDLIESRFVLEESLKNSKRYPVSGTFTIDDLESDIMHLYDNGTPDVISPKGIWFQGLEDEFTVMRGHLVTVTGIPSHGKSTFTDWYIMNLLEDYNMKASWFSPEHHPMSIHQANMISNFSGKPFYRDIEGVQRIQKSEIQNYKEWAREKIYLTGPDKDQSPTWSWLLDKFKEQIYSFGIDIFVIDAFNKVLFDNSSRGHLQQITEVLTKLTAFAQQNNVIIFLIAHPTKMRKKEDGTYEAPNLYDVAGSADFRNMTHDGFCIYRVFEDENTADETIFTNLKTKFSFQGNIGAQRKFKYHAPSGRYYNPVNAYTGFPLSEPQRNELKLEFNEEDDFPEWVN